MKLANCDAAIIFGSMREGEGVEGNKERKIQRERKEEGNRLNMHFAPVGAACRNSGKFVA